MAFKDRLGDRRSELRFEIIGQLWGSLEVDRATPAAERRDGAARSSRRASR